MILSRLQLFLSTSFGLQKPLTLPGHIVNEPRIFDDSPGRPTAELVNGTIEGVYLPTYNQDVWLGIPFAEPPIENNRYRRPKSLNGSWDDVRTYETYSPFCIGYGSDQDAYKTSEDCLTINVVRPAGSFSEALPVAAWIHGGGFFKGSSSDLRYNLSFIVEQSVKSHQPMIGVSFNYRLGPWGFLAGPAVNSSGNSNLGLHDQRLALHWIQENIIGFGGDPEKVTLWGESAGASSVGFHLIAYGGRDDRLFRGAIMQSGSPIPFMAFDTPSTKVDEYSTILRRLKCPFGEDSLDCVRNKTFNELNSAFNHSGTTPVSSYNETETWVPVLDGDFVRTNPSKQLADKQYVNVSVIVGTCTDEGTAYAPIPGFEDVEDTRTLFLGSAHTPNLSFIGDLLKSYPMSDTFGPPYQINEGGYKGNLSEVGMNQEYRRVAAYFGDYLFIANHRKTCETWAGDGIPAYCFRFNVQSAGQPWHFGIKHLQDVAFVFYNLNGTGYDAAHNSTQGVNPFEGKPESYRNLADFISRSWVSFVHDLDPNSFRKYDTKFRNEPLWPLYKDGAKQLLFDADNGTRVEIDDYRAAAIKLINDHPEMWSR